MNIHQFLRVLAIIMAAISPFAIGLLLLAGAVVLLAVADLV